MSRFFLREIDAEFLQALRSPDLLEALAEIDPEAADILDRDWCEDGFESAAVEYCRLFVQPGVCPPRASAWIQGGVKSGGGLDESAAGGLADRLIAAAGLQLEEPLRSLPHDHLSVLFELRAWLETERLAREAEEFAAAALEPWIDRFSDRLKKEAAHPIYRAAAKMLGG